jgi:hypothetical protein
VKGGLFDTIAAKMEQEWLRMGTNRAQMEQEIRTALQRLGKYDIATIGSSYLYDADFDKENNRFNGINPANITAFSILNKFDRNEYENRSDVADKNTDYINDAGYVKALIYNAKTRLLWMGIKDNKGRIQYKYDGYETAPGQFEWVWVSKVNYEWPSDKDNLGAIGIAYSSKTHFYQKYVNIEMLASQLADAVLVPGQGLLVEQLDAILGKTIKNPKQLANAKLELRKSFLLSRKYTAGDRALIEKEFGVLLDKVIQQPLSPYNVNLGLSSEIDIDRLTAGLTQIYSQVPSTARDEKIQAILNKTIENKTARTKLTSIIAEVLNDPELAGKSPDIIQARIFSAIAGKFGVVTESQIIPFKP